MQMHTVIVNQTKIQFIIIYHYIEFSSSTNFKISFQYPHRMDFK